MQKNKQFSLLILAIFAMVFLASCVTKPVVNQQPANNQNEIPKEEIKYLENGEIDTSDWKTYQNNKYGISIKYPPFLETKALPSDARFSWRYATDKNINKNWDFWCENMNDGNYLYNEAYEKKQEALAPENRNADYYERININRGMIFYTEFNREQYESFDITVWVLKDNGMAVSCQSDIHEEEAIQDETDNDRYGKVYISMLKTLEFID